MRIGSIFFGILILSLLRAQGVYAQIQRIEFVPVAQEALVNSYVRCFYKDSKGYMWLGAAEGLIRYDGTNIYRYEHNSDDPSTLSHNHINVILEDPDHRLWVGTAAGLCLYDREKDNFISINSLVRDHNNPTVGFVTSLSLDPSGRLWIGTLGGISIYDPVTSTITPLLEPKTGAPPSGSSFITSLLCVGELMWCGTKGGLSLFDAIDKTPRPMTFTGDKLPDTQVSQLINDKAGNIWLSTLKGRLFKLVPGNDSYAVEKITFSGSERDLALDNILTICLDNNDDNLWIGGEHSGLNYLDTKTNELTRFPAEAGNPKKLPTNSIRAVYVDNSGLKWIGTFYRGAYLIDKNASIFENYYPGNFSEGELTGAGVVGFAEDKEGTVWIAYDGMGLRKLDGKTNTLQNCDEINDKLANKYLTSLLIDDDSNFWMGTVGDGVYNVNPKTLHVENFKLRSGGFGDDKVYNLYQDIKGKIWAGTGGSGLFYFDEATRQFVSLCDEGNPDHISKTAYISQVLDDSNGTLWVSTMYGMFALERKGGNSYDYRLYLNNDPGSISSPGVQVIYEDRRKNLWIGTTDNGLNVKMKGASEFITFQKKDGLPTNFIRGIVEDESGNLWISGNMGLSKFNPYEHKFTNYAREDGLISNNFLPNAAFKSSSGKLFFGSASGFNAFYPDSILSDSVKPVVYLTDLRINNQSVPIGDPASPLQKHISLTSEVELTYQQRSFRIDFVALGYEKSIQHKYCYRLIGFDETWNCVGSSLNATYTNINPGTYVFQVKAAHNDEVGSDATTQLRIRIHPVFWKTWWAMSLYVVVIAFVILILVKIRIERVKMKSQLTLERLAREQEHELSESKTQFFTNVSHEFRTPLSLISLPLENLISMEGLAPAVREKLLTIKLSANKMIRLVNELMDFNKLESSGLKLRLQYGDLVKFVKTTATAFFDVSERRNIHFGIHAQVPALEGWFDHDKLEKIVVNVLSNAFKFTSDHGEIKLIINSRSFGTENGQARSRCLEIVIIDNGIGISAEELPFIFDKFYQARSSEKIANSGTGIGLSLTKGLVELHHGKIKAESAPNRETKFEILIPIDRHVYTEDDVFEIPDNLTTPDINDHVKTGDDYISVSEGDRNQSKPKALIVEDNYELRKYISLELSKEFQVMEASDGDEGLKIALEKNPDIIVSDILMPGKSGTELCREIKSNLRSSHIPVILLTSKTTVDDQVAGISMGADVYITKPFSIRFLTAHIHNIIRSRRKLYAQFSQNIYLLPAKMAGNKIDSSFLNKAIDYVVENMQDPQLGVDAIANLFHLSRMQVYRKIKALTGKSVVDFIRTIRIKQALQLMNTQQYTLSEIAYRTGFNSASYFTKCFKDQFGKAPSEYLEKKAE